MRYSVCLCAVWLLGFCAAVCPAYAGDGDHLLPVAGTQWKGRKVAFMGDSITDKAHVGTTKNYWQYLQEMLGLVPFVYVGRKAKLAASGTGALKDIAPSLLAMMGLPKPAEMTGNSLVSFE